jgi:hypothetical protein
MSIRITGTKRFAVLDIDRGTARSQSVFDLIRQAVHLQTDVKLDKSTQSELFDKLAAPMWLNCSSYWSIALLCFDLIVHYYSSF